MTGTIIAFLLSTYLYFAPEAYSYAFGPDFVSITMLVVASGALLGIPLIFVSAYFPLLKAEQKLTPHLLSLFSSDRKIRLYTGWLIGFAILTYVLVMLDLSKGVFDQKLVFSIWIILLGISTDFTYSLTRKMFSYLNPFEVVTMFSEKAQEDIRENRDQNVFHSIDGLMEIGLKSVHYQSSSITGQVTDEIDKIVKVFLESSKSLGHYDPEATTEGIGGTDKASYTLFYLFQRIEMLFNKALESKNEPLCNHIIQAMGKIMIHAAKYDITLATDPLHYIGKFTHRAMSEGMVDVGDMTSCTLQEVARIMIDEIDLTYLEIKDVYVGIIICLDEIAKELFRHNKSISIPFLTLPFEKLQTLFASDKVNAHQDTPVILQNIKRVLIEFETLKTVLEGMPIIPQGKEAPKEPEQGEDK